MMLRKPLNKSNHFSKPNSNRLNQEFLKEPLNKSNNFELAKTADIFTENRDSFYCAQILLT